MNKQVIKENVITLEQLENIKEDPNVDRVDFNGCSGMYLSHKWYSIIYLDGSEKDVYINNQY